MCTSIAWIVIAAVVILVALTFLIIDSASYGAIDDGILTVFVIIAAIGLIIIGCQVFDIIECNVFPEKVLYDYINSQIKGG